MHSDGKAYYPTRSFIRFQAKNMLIKELMNGQELTVVSRFRELGIHSLQESDPSDNPHSSDPEQNDTPLNENHVNEVDSEKKPFSVDEALFAEIAATAFHADQYPELYEGTGSQEEAMDVERAIAQEIVADYQRILKNRTDKTIQDLNALLQ